MTAIADIPESPLPVGRPRSLKARGGVIGLLRAKACASLLQWGFWNAIWTAPAGQSDACRAIRGLGACWAVIPEKIRFILFGTYPFDQQWRPAAATLTFVALFFV